MISILIQDFCFFLRICLTSTFNAYLVDPFSGSNFSSAFHIQLRTEKDHRTTRTSGILLLLYSLGLSLRHYHAEGLQDWSLRH